MSKNLLLVFLFVGVSSLLQAQNIADIYAKVVPSVVKIYVEEAIVDPRDGKTVAAGQGLGSGALIDESGLILTASHVVQTTQKILVEFPDGDRYPGEVLYSSPAADVALLKLAIEPTGKKAIPLGNSDSTKIGDQIIMIGSPRGLSYSLSVGHISGRQVKRKFSNGSPYIEFFQTDASINPGNSGGPMLNMNGEIVGVASFILTESGGFEGLGFAATSNVCKDVLLDVRTPWTGIEGKMLQGELAKIFHLPMPGLLVQKVAPLSPGDLIGLRGGSVQGQIGGESMILGGDVILRINGVDFSTEENINRIIEREIESDEVILDILRGGEEVRLTGTFKKE
jgi:serine protease Do